ncbi:hypothetical protein ACO0LF_31035 [Undibacterium sp. Di27W]|uniref:hypothetical protein n=1 Tax=Undibacterium sp. Di27W TaxID=3413036 RepID=UPI003BF343AA
MATKIKHLVKFLIERVKHGKKVLYITLSETALELHAVAKAHSWSLEDVNIQEVLPSKKILDPDKQYTIFHPDGH